MDKMPKLHRAVIALTIALAISFSAISSTQHMPPEGRADQYDNCRGARFMQLMNAGSGIAICGFFGPYACAGYAGIVLAYEIFAWYETGGC